MLHFRDACFIVLCTGILVFYGATERPLTRSSEGRVARVAQEMLDDGDWVVPHLNGVVRLEKPPFSSWLVALFSTSVSTPTNGTIEIKAWHAYVPPGIATVLLVLLVFGWLIQSGPGVAGISSHAPPVSGMAMFAALVLASAPGFFNQARSAEMDMLLALWVALALWGFWKNRITGCRVALLIAYVALGLSILTKGHVGLVIVIPTLLFWGFAERSHAALTLPAARSARWHVLGIALILAMVLPWGIPFLQRSGLTWDAFNREGLGGRVGSDVPHYEAFYWYLIQVPGWFLPWTVLFVIGLWQTWNLPPDERSPLRRLCWIWFGWSMLLFSALSSKQRHYAIPFFPPIAMLIADTTYRWLTHPEAAPARAARITLSVFSALLALAALMVVPAVSKASLLDASLAAQCWILAAMAAALFAFAGLKLFRGVQCGNFFWWSGCVCLLVIFSQTVERRDAQFSPEPFCAKVRALVPADAELYDYDVALPRREGAKGKPVWRAQVLFYLRRKVVETDVSLGELLNQKRNIYVITSGKNLEGLRPELFVVLAHDEKFLGHKNDVLLIQSLVP